MTRARTKRSGFWVTNWLGGQDQGGRRHRESQFRRRLSTEALEDRRLLATVTVTNMSDQVNGFTASISGLIANPGIRRYFAARGDQSAGRG